MCYIINKDGRGAGEISINLRIAWRVRFLWMAGIFRKNWIPKISLSFIVKLKKNKHSLHKEMNIYDQLKVEIIHNNPLHFWQENRHNFPIKVAFRVFVTQGSSFFYSRWYFMRKKNSYVARNGWKTNNVENKPKHRFTVI